MKRLAIIFTLIFSTTIFVNAQIVHIRSFDSQVKCLLAEEGNKFVISQFEAPKSSAQWSRCIKSVEVVEGNIVFELELPELFVNEHLELEWEVRLGSRSFRIPPEALSKHVVFPNEPRRPTITWHNPFDLVPFGLEEFWVDLSVHFYGPECDLGEPSFDWKDQRPYVGAALLGGVMIGVGELVFAKQAKDDYRDYEAITITEQLEQLTQQQEVEAEGLLKQAKDSQNTANSIRRVGQVLVAGGAILYGLRYFKFKKDFKQWKRYCDTDSPTLGFEPIYRQYPTGNAVGLAVTFTF